MNLSDKLSKTCPCPSAWDRKNERGYSAAELGYFRCDYDGYKWWNTVWPINPELKSPELVTEFNSVLDSFYETFPTLDDLKSYCHKHLLPHPSPIEFNVWLDLGGPGYYWLRIRLIERDYNLYMHCISKAALAGEPPHTVYTASSLTEDQKEDLKKQTDRILAYAEEKRARKPAKEKD